MTQFAETYPCDALVIGAGPAGAGAAILLARAGWQVTLVEQHVFPRQKVCGECIAAGNFELLDQLGVGDAVRAVAGQELQRVGWMHKDTAVVAEMPACFGGYDPYGRALGRDVLDTLLLERARAVGVEIMQPARVRRISGRPGDFTCHVDRGRPHSATGFTTSTAVQAGIIIDAHGSWESELRLGAVDARGVVRKIRQRESDLFAFKANFLNSGLALGLLPVLAVPGGYGGMVVSDRGRTTLALCLRRDALRALRVGNHGMAPGLVIENYLRNSCRGVRESLQHAQREGSWLSVGPLRPGVRLGDVAGIFRVGNAAGETHPLIGEGISMALQSSKLLVNQLLRFYDRKTDSKSMTLAQRAYACDWRQAFMPRLRFAALYAHIAMRTSFAGSVDACLRRWPALLTRSASLAGKTRHAIESAQPH